MHASVDAPTWALELIAEVRGLRLAVERLSAPSSLCRRDRETLARVLPAIAGAVGSDPFLASEICSHASPDLRLVCRDTTPRALGRLLKRAQGTPVDGYFVERIGVEAGAIIWSVTASP